jgi:hypothetical protein
MQFAQNHVPEFDGMLRDTRVKKKSPRRLQEAAPFYLSADFAIKLTSSYLVPQFCFIPG